MNIYHIFPIVESCADGQELIQDTYCLSFHASATAVDLSGAARNCEIRGGNLAVPTEDFVTVEFADELRQKFTSPG